MLIRRSLFFAVPFLVLACATGTTGETDDGGSGSGGSNPNGPLAGYSYRRAITVTSSTPAGVSVPLVIDHAALVGAEKALANGQDLRITYELNGTVTQLDRVLDPLSAWGDDQTEVWFRTAAEVVEGSGSYYVYYGNSSADQPPADGTAVYDIWDDFEDGAMDAAWKLDTITSMIGNLEETEGVLRLTGTTQNFGGTEDNFVMVTRDMDGDFVMDVEIRGGGGSLGAASKVGGLVIRQSADAGGRQLAISPQRTPAKRVAIARDTDGAANVVTDFDSSEEFPQAVRITRTGNTAAALYFQDGNWIGLGSSVSFTAGLNDPIKVGVPFANSSGGNGWVDIEWIRIRRVNGIEPTGVPEDEEMF